MYVFYMYSRWWQNLTLHTRGKSVVSYLTSSVNHGWIKLSWVVGYWMYHVSLGQLPSAPSATRFSTLLSSSSMVDSLTSSRHIKLLSFLHISRLMDDLCHTFLFFHPSRTSVDPTRLVEEYYIKIQRYGMQYGKYLIWYGWRSLFSNALFPPWNIH